jgi:CRISPR-associated endoribonuclease Cas6
LLSIRAPSKSIKKGFYRIPKETSGLWFLNTIQKNIAEAVAKNKIFHFGRMVGNIETVEVEDKSYFIPPENLNTITIKFHTPVVFYRNSEKKYYPLSEKSILDWQLHKMKQLGIVDNFDVNELRPYIRIIRNDTKKRGMHIRLPNNDQLIRIEGSVGYLTIKLNGDNLIKEHMWNIFYIGKFIGMGSNSNLGFGHYRIKI